MIQEVTPNIFSHVCSAFSEFFDSSKKLFSFGSKVEGPREMSRDQEGVCGPDRGVKEKVKKELKKAGKRRKDIPIHILATGKLSSGSTDARKAIFISCF